MCKTMTHCLILVDLFAKEFRDEMVPFPVFPYPRCNRLLVAGL
jgi:hypothetical protein